MTRPVSTQRILAEKVLQKTCGQQCVDWALGMLESGHDGEYLRRLAVMEPPHNHFETASLRDWALEEQGVSNISFKEAVLEYAKDILRRALDGEKNIREAIAEVARLCWTSDYVMELNDFYLMDDAYDDLISTGVQWSFDVGTLEELEALARERAEEFVSGPS